MNSKAGFGNQFRHVAFMRLDTFRLLGDLQVIHLAFEIDVLRIKIFQRILN
jgi:hypothetical protein